MQKERLRARQGRAYQLLIGLVKVGYIGALVDGPIKGEQDGVFLVSFLAITNNHQDCISYAGVHIALTRREADDESRNLYEGEGEARRKAGLATVSTPSFLDRRPSSSLSLGDLHARISPSWQQATFTSGLM